MTAYEAALLAVPVAHLDRADVRCAPFGAFGIPVLIEPVHPALASSARSVAAWFRDSALALDSILDRRGAILLRGFAISSTADFGMLVEDRALRKLDYVGGASPRREIAGKIFESTRFPAVFKLGLHCEMSYMPAYPSRICFYCALPAKKGGETIIGDMRQVYRRLAPELVERFARRRLKYMRNFRAPGTPPANRSPLLAGLHRDWAEAFGTERPETVEARCRKLGLKCTWLADGSAAVEHDGDAILRHPRTGVPTWFNQATTFYPNARSYGPLYPLVRSTYRDPRTLPFNVAYADGGEIAPEDLEQVYEALDAVTVAFDWHAGDVMILDNLAIAHGRNPYSGKRDVQVALMG